MLSRLVILGYETSNAVFAVKSGRYASIAAMSERHSHHRNKFVDITIGSTSCPYQAQTRMKETLDNELKAHFRHPRMSEVVMVLQEPTKTMLH
jgi:hypothetical protein